MQEVITNFYCKLCKKYYSSASSLCNHNNKYHSNLKKCINNTYNTHNKLDNIINIKKYNCNKCDRLFINYQNRWKHEKICKNNYNNNNKLEKENIEIKDILKELLETNCKIHPKTLQNINNNYTINNDLTQYVIDDDIQKNIIIKSDDNKFSFDFNKNFLTFYDKPIKYFYYNDQVYFKGKDIASILGYEDTLPAIQKNVDSEDRINISELFGEGVFHTTLHQVQFLENEHPQTVFINESGFYNIIFISQKEEAKKFKRWVTSTVLPSIRKTGSYNLIDNYIEEDIDKYQNKDCVYIIHIKDNIYKYGYTSHIFKRLQAHKTNLNYNKIIKIYDMDNMNKAINLETKIKKLTKLLNINIVYNNHIEIFKIDNNNLQHIIKKIDELSLTIINNNSIIIEDNNIIIEKEKTKQLELENENLKLKLELFKLSK